MEPIAHTAVPHDQSVTYGTIVCNHGPLKKNMFLETEKCLMPQSV